MAGQTWRRRKDWRYDIWSRCYRCSPHRGILTGYRGPRGGYRLAREPSDISVEDILRSIGSVEDDSLLNGVVLPAWSYETSASAMI
jgi:Iron-dependent Transcriptional regulator